MKPNEIRAHLLLNNKKIKNIAELCDVTASLVCMVISGIRKTLYVRQAIADAIGKPVSEVFPEALTEEQPA